MNVKSELWFVTFWALSNKGLQAKKAMERLEVISPHEESQGKQGGKSWERTQTNLPDTLNQGLVNSF